MSDVTFEAIGDAIAAIASETTTNHGFDSVTVALDNLENLDPQRLGDVLISLRDTLFSTPRVWWVLIGQSGLGSLIQSLDSRVFERTTGSGLEMGPLGLEEMHTAISLRVQRFHISGAGTSPLGADTHKFLYDASHGETRFVFKYSNSICAKFVESIRQKVWNDPDVKRQQSEPDARERFSAALDDAIARHLINKQIAPPLARSHLQGIVGAELQGLFLKPKEKQVLAKIGELGVARASDHKAFSVKSAQDFSSNYLSKFHGQKLLAREQQGRAVLYKLRGVARLAHTFGFLTQP